MRQVVEKLRIPFQKLPKRVGALILLAYNSASYAFTQKEQEKVERLFLGACNDLRRAISLLQNGQSYTQVNKQTPFGDISKGSENFEEARRCIANFAEKMKQVAELKTHPFTIKKLQTHAHACLRQALPMFSELYLLIHEKLSALGERDLEKVKELCWQISDQGRNPLFFLGFPASVLINLRKSLPEALVVQSPAPVTSVQGVNIDRAGIPIIAGTFQLTQAKSNTSIQKLANSLYAIWQACSNLETLLLANQSANSSSQEEDLPATTVYVSIAERLKYLLRSELESRPSEGLKDILSPQEIIRTILEPVKNTVTEFILKHSSEQIQSMWSSFLNLKESCIKQVSMQQKNFQRAGPEARLASVLKGRFTKFIEALFAPIIQNQPRYFDSH